MRLDCFLPILLAFALGPGGHADNPVFKQVVSEGLTLEGTTVLLPEPSLADGLDAERSMAVLRKIAGDDRAAKELLRDSVTAPFILKTRDVTAGGSTVRVADLWFVVHARIEDIDPDRVLRQADGKPVEAGNMRFENKFLSDRDLSDRKIEPLPPLDGRTEWYTHLTGRLLDRIKVESTDRAVVTRSAESLVVASRTDQTFDEDGAYPNRWTTLARKGVEETFGPPRKYAGGQSYAKITRLAAEPGALLVESHFAFVEPLDWFQGNPILRSKFGVIAQEQIRQLRREIAKNPGRGTSAGRSKVKE